MRVAYMYSIYYTTYDTTWAAATVWSWTLVEAHFAIICASAPALKLFFRRFLQSTQGHSYTTRQRADYNNFGSSAAELGAVEPGHRSKGGGDDDAEGIYLADMLAFKATRDEAERKVRKSKGLPQFSTIGGGSGDGSLKSPVSVTVTEDAEESTLADAGGGTLSEMDARTIEERSTKSIVRSRGSTDSILETHVAARTT